MGEHPELMTSERSPENQDTPACPACGGSPLRVPPGEAGGIRGGVPSAAAIHATTRPGPARISAEEAVGPLACRRCGEALYRFRGDLLRHRGTAPMLPMHVAAERLRNHLRRLAITRVGLIDGDCYLLPYYRLEGAPPEGDSSTTVLAARLGEARLESPSLPAADLRPYGEPADGAAGPAGEGHAVLRVLPPTISWKEAAARAGKQEGTAAGAAELIHYPFWLMRVGDAGRTEGVWMDGIEARLIFHRIRLAPTMPSRLSRAGWTALPAVAAAAGAVVRPSLALPVAVVTWLAAAPVLHAALLRRWNG